MYKVDMPVERSEEKAVERRRSAEAKRKARIFNTRQRVMGLDLDALNQQVQEKTHQQNMEMRRNKAFDKLKMHQDQLLLQQDINERKKRAAVHTDLTQYWATHQRAEDSQDADLKQDLRGAFRITIPESELGPASMQIFEGEDIGEEQRRREQMKKTERDLQAQREENKRRLMGDKHREMLVSKELLQQNLREVQLHAQEEECRKAARAAIDDYNQALAAERTEKLREQHRREEREKLAEMLHIVTSDMMTECEKAAEMEMGGGGPPRILVDRWKGMNPEQLSAIQREREEQHLQRQRHRDAEKIQNAAWDLQLLKLSRKAEEEERRAEELRKEKRIQMDHRNMQLAREQQAYEEFLNKRLYTNKPTKDYFNQFNTSSR